MKTKLLFIFVQLFICSIYMIAQNNEPVVLKEGNLEYIKKIGVWIQRKGTEDLTGKSYVRTYCHIEIDSVRSIFRSVFPRERAKELSNVFSRFFCQFEFDSVENKLLYTKYYWNKDEPFPIKLSELDQLDRKLMLIDYKLKHDESLILDHTWSFSIPIIFGTLYD